MSGVKPWPLLAKRTITENRIFRLTGRDSVSPRTGAQHEFYVLECPDWVNIVPLTEDGEVVLVRQYRHGTGDFTLEIPGGMVDPGDRDPAEAAAREMLEETGYRAGQVEHLGSISPNPAIQVNQCHSYLATGLERVAEPLLDGAEDLEVLSVPLARIPAMIAGGEINHALVVVAFTYMLGLVVDGQAGGR